MNEKTIEEKLVTFPKIVALSLADGNPDLFRILTAFPFCDKHYVALAPCDAEGNPVSSQISLFEIRDGEGDSLKIHNIDSDDEYSRVADAFAAICEKL